MKNLSKNQIIGLVAILIVLIIGGIFYLTSPLKEKALPPEKEEPIPEIFSLAAVISEIDSENNFLIVKHPREEKEIKVILSEDTEIIQLKFPFDPAHPPKEATFTPKRIPITVADLEAGDNILVETTINIYDKTEFDDVSRIQVLP